jgi:hypothetical protein
LLLGLNIHWLFMLVKINGVMSGGSPLRSRSYWASSSSVSSRGNSFCDNCAGGAGVRVERSQKAPYAPYAAEPYSNSPAGAGKQTHHVFRLIRQVQQVASGWLVRQLVIVVGSTSSRRVGIPKLVDVVLARARARV